MKWKSIIWKLIKWIFKLAFKLFLIALWGTLRMVEVILSHLNKWLKEQIK
jgi:hypothetical protein